jgi:nonspecific dipeptidase
MACTPPTMPTSDSFATRFFAHVDASVPQYISELGEAVGIPSVSSDLATHLPDIIKMMEWTKSYVEQLGGTCTLLPNPVKKDEDGNVLPPILLAEFKAEESPETKKTVCCYAHLDVQPAVKEDGWDSDPFVLTERDEKLYGRGSTDDKGPALSWLWVIQAHRKLNVGLPLNVKLMFEGMEESGSVGMFEAIRMLSKEKEFLSDVDFFCISDK